MKKLILIAIISSLFFAGCSNTIENAVSELQDIASRVGDVEYSRVGFYSNSTLNVTTNEDGTKNADYSVTGKLPGGPSLEISVTNIKQTNGEETEKEGEE